MKSKRKNSRMLSVGGVLVECTTVQGLADIIGKSRDSVARYEELGYFPVAPLRVGSYRYYPITLCERLKEVVANFPPNRKPDAELLVRVNQIFSEERSKLCQKV